MPTILPVPPDSGDDDASRRTRHVEALAAWRRRSAEEKWLTFHGDAAPFVPRTGPGRGGRVRVGLLCPCLGLGGAEAWQLALARAVDPHAVEWRGAVVTDGRRGVAPAMLGALAEAMPVGFGLEAARSLGRESDVLISWSVLDHRALARGLADPPRVILACHFPGERPWTDGAERLLRSVDRRVAVSELALESLPISLRAETRVIWNAVDAARLEPTRAPATTRAEWGVPAGSQVAGFLGRLAPEKDPAAMLRLAEVIPPPWHVVLVGDGREGPALASEVERLGLDRVRLVPGTAAVGDALAAFDALVVPSRFESFGLTLSEGLWAGVPVVAPPVGLAKIVPGLVRAVGPDPSGAELARAIRLDHETDPAGRRERVARAGRFARDRLGMDRFGREWTDLIVELGTASRAAIPEEEACRPPR